MSNPARASRGLRRNVQVIFEEIQSLI